MLKFEDENQEIYNDNLTSLSTFATEDPNSYLCSYLGAARALLESGEKVLGPEALCSVLVHIHRHSIELKLKQLTIGAAKFLGKPLTAHHVRTIGHFSIGQLWSTLTVMLDQLGDEFLSEGTLDWRAMETQLQQLSQFDGDFYALRSITGFASVKRKKSHSADGKAPPAASPIKLIDMLERLSERLVSIERRICQ